MLCSRIRKKLEYALIVLVQENHIDSIKIKDLVLIAHISTSTFYGNFENLDDFIEYTIDEIFAAFQQDCSIFKRIPNSTTCVFKLMADAFDKHRLILSSAYNSRYRSIIEKNIDAIFSDRLQFCIDSEYLLNESLEKIELFLSSGYKGLISKYIDTADRSYLDSASDLLQKTIELYSSSKYAKKALN
ncbi:MAG: hypothetical protein E7A81_03000 [Clostridiales bacterium]|nr:hypothetical protein [Clostridiales bacterium]MDU1042116.1 hypothetical protein [Clostridiales bacterium]